MLVPWRVCVHAFPSQRFQCFVLQKSSRMMRNSEISGPLVLINLFSIPSLKLTVRTWKWMVGMWNTTFRLKWSIFRGYLSFRECSWLLVKVVAWRLILCWHLIYSTNNLFLNHQIPYVVLSCFIYFYGFLESPVFFSNSTNYNCNQHVPNQPTYLGLTKTNQHVPNQPTNQPTHLFRYFR